MVCCPEETVSCSFGLSHCFLMITVKIATLRILPKKLTRKSPAMNHTDQILVSFAADSLALGPHWIYDPIKIDREFGRVDSLCQPLADSFHKTKNKGDFTHYGDQALLLLSSIISHQGFSLSGFADDWKAMMNSYTGYIDGASRKTLEHMGSGADPDECGSPSSDLGGAARIAPLIWRYHDDQEKLLESVRQQTVLTHNNPATIAGAECLARIVLLVLRGTTPVAAINQVLAEGIGDEEVAEKMRQACETAGADTTATIQRFGPACGITAALPGAIHLVCSYEDDPTSALIANVMAGGESAARGMAAGMILGAHHGIEAIPRQWLTEMNAYKHITELIQR
jgi:ADP-ribosylglycohydrolase